MKNVPRGSPEFFRLIAKEIGTRTETQVRSHHQKFLIREEKKKAHQAQKEWKGKLETSNPEPRTLRKMGKVSYLKMGQEGVRNQ